MRQTVAVGVIKVRIEDSLSKIFFFHKIHLHSTQHTTIPLLNTPPSLKQHYTHSSSPIPIQVQVPLQIFSSPSDQSYKQHYTALTFLLLPFRSYKTALHYTYSPSPPLSKLQNSITPTFLLPLFTNHKTPLHSLFLSSLSFPLPIQAQHHVS